MTDMNKEIRVVIYHIDDSDVDVHTVIQNESLWITQKAMAELFEVKVTAINKHLKYIYDEGEINECSTISKMEIVQTEGKNRIRV